MKKIFYSILLFLCFGCSDLKQAYVDIEDLQDRVSVIESSLSALQNAYNDGKIIKDVLPYKDVEYTGWTIIFSDNETITILDGLDGVDGKDGADGIDGIDGKDGKDGKDGADGKDGVDGVTPIVAINPDGYWIVSYDNGENFSLIEDAEGKPIMSKGEKGNEGLSIRINIDENGFYIIESFYASNPNDVVDVVSTQFTSDPSKQISSIIKDPYTGIIKLIMNDGSQYDFNLDVTFPTSIVVLAESVVLPKNGTSVVTFRVNPSNAVVDLNVSHDEPMFELDMAIESMTRSYVTESGNYKLEKIEPSKDSKGNVKEGQYLAFISSLGLSDDFCEGATFVLNTKDGKGNEIQVSSDIFKIMTPEKPQFTIFSINESYASDLEKELICVKLPYGTDVSALKPYFAASEGTVSVNGKQIQPYTPIDFSSPVEFTITTEDGRDVKYVVSISYSDIPVVYINTKNAAPIVSKEDWLKSTDIYITNAGEYSEIYTSAQIKGRGNTTWGYPKKPYAIKLDSKDDVLGMPKHKRWVLLANYLDKTCIRNSIAFEISKRSSAIAWTPRGYHVDVVLNGVFMGNYFLCEQIKIDENRVNITEMEATDIDEESITGGYLLELDKNMDENFCFYTPARPDRPIELPIMVKEPEDPSAEQRIWLQNYITEVETALYSEGSTTEDYLKYIDLDSFIDYWLVYELTGTGEPTQPKSVYMWKERRGKIHAGPVWDFDYYTFQSAYKNALINSYAVWNNRIIQDPSNRSAIKARWMESRAKYETILDEIDRQYAIVKESAEYDATLWPILDIYLDRYGNDPNREKKLTVEQSVENMKTYYQAKFQYMDSYFSAY